LQSTQTGAPSVMGQEGALISVLNACLLNGYNLKSVESIERGGNVATVTVPTGHGYRDGDMIRVSGATPNAYNGDWRIKNCATTTFDFDIEGEPDTPASGTISAKVAPLGWESPFTGTNKAAYRSLDPTSDGMYLRVDDNSITGGAASNGYLATTATIQMCETMTDIDTTGGVTHRLFWRKSTTVTSDPKEWFVIGDRKRFWLGIKWTNDKFMIYFFGDVLPFKAGDAYSSLVAGYSELMGMSYPNTNTDTVYNSSLSYGASSTVFSVRAARSYTQVGEYVSGFFTSGGQGNGYALSGVSSVLFPNPADNGIFVEPVMFLQVSGTRTLRSRLPGYYFALHAINIGSTIVRFKVVVIGGAERDLLCVPLNDGGCVCFDATGDWA
jgi:hypothetical protein